VGVGNVQDYCWRISHLHDRLSGGVNRDPADFLSHLVVVINILLSGMRKTITYVVNAGKTLDEQTRLE